MLDIREPFEIWMDHENLKYFREPYKLNGWQTRWYLKLQDYNFTLWHILGKTNIKTDILSRKDQVDIQEDNKDAKMLKEELMTRRTTAEIAMLKKYKSLEDSNLLEEIQRNNTREQKVEQELKKENGLAWEQDGIIYIEEQIYIPNNRNLKE